MSFLKKITAERISAEDSQITVRVENINAIRLAKIFSFLLAVIAGTAEMCKEFVQSCTDAIMKFVELGGLATEEGVQLFRDYFTKCPDKFYAFSLPELWAALKDKPELQDHIAGVYYERVLPYEGPEEHFHWAVKSLLNIFASAGASPADTKFVVGRIIEENTELLKKESQNSVWNLLSAVKESGEYRRPQKRDEVRVADKGHVVPKGGQPVQRQNLLGEEATQTEIDIYKAAQQSAKPPVHSLGDDLKDAGVRGRKKPGPKPKVNGQAVLHQPAPMANN